MQLRLSGDKPVYKQIVKATHRLSESLTLMLLCDILQVKKDEEITVIYTEFKSQRLFRMTFYKKHVYANARHGDLYIKAKAPETKAQRRVYLKEFDIIDGDIFIDM